MGALPDASLTLIFIVFDDTTRWRELLAHQAASNSEDNKNDKYRARRRYKHTPGSLNES